MNREAYVVYNFNCSYRNWRRFPKVTDRHVHCKSERWYLGNGVRQRRVYYRSLQQVITANRISPFPMTWVFFKVIHPLQAFPNAILRTFVQQMTKLQLTQSVARSLCYSRGCRASCLRLLHCILRRRKKTLRSQSCGLRRLCHDASRDRQLFYTQRTPESVHVTLQWTACGRLRSNRSPLSIKRLLKLVIIANFL